MTEADGLNQGGVAAIDVTEAKRRVCAEVDRLGLDSP